MIWTKERDDLYPQTSKFRDFGHNDKISKNDRNKILQKNDSTCRYCGGKYQKYLICNFIGNAKCNDVCCRACFIITHLNYGVFNEIKIYYSTMSQLDIVRRTINYIIDNNEIPHPINIDKDIKKTQISVLEYINIINNQEKFPTELKHYKIFFSKHFDINFIINNYGSEMIVFVNDNDNKTCVKKKKTNISVHQLPHDFLIKYF